MVKILIILVAALLIAVQGTVAAALPSKVNLQQKCPPQSQCAGYFTARAHTGFQIPLVSAGMRLSSNDSIKPLSMLQTGIVDNPPPNDTSWLYLSLAAAISAMLVVIAVSLYIYRIHRKSAKSLSLLKATLESTNDAILVVDLKNTWKLHNRQFVEMWRIPPQIIAAKDDKAALSYVLDQLEDADVFLNKVRELYAYPEISSFDKIRFRDGKTIERYSIRKLSTAK